MSSRESSLLLLIDGYNVVSPAAAPARGGDANWLHHERMRLIGRLAERLDEEVRCRTCVVFDAANPPRNRPSRFQVDEIDVRFAVGYAEADDLIEELISLQSAPKQMAVVSSDHRIQASARRRGCATFDSEPWLDELLEGKLHLASPRQRGAGQGSPQGQGNSKPKSVSRAETRHWMKEFGFDAE
ncbi:MAG: NYN domain-containing protein [Pirellulales bacterium]|nr:NYN domain-containing protein [Pirellulales bacterium]